MQVENPVAGTGIPPALGQSIRAFFNKTVLDTGIFYAILPHVVHNRRQTWSLAELAEQAGLSPRTIRYYISRGLLDGPLAAGRGAAYTEDHLARLNKIRELQARGLMLAEIRLELSGIRAAACLPPADSWDRYPIAEDVTVWVRKDIAPWRSRTIARALAEFAARMKRDGNHDHHDERD